MPNVSHGPRRKTRHKLRRGPREKTTITNRLQSFEEGDTVTVRIDPSIHGGMPHPRFHGRTGKVVGEQGNAYKIRVDTEHGSKQVITTPAHLTTGD